MSRDSMFKLVIRFLCLIFIALSFSSCSTLKLLKASETKTYGFVPKYTKLKSLKNHSPFQRRSVTKKLRLYESLKNENKNIYIAKINTKFIERMLTNEVSDLNKREELKDELRLIAEYFHNKLQQEIKRQNPKHRLLAAPQAETIAVKIALVELEPTNPAINLLGTATGFFVPGGGLIKIAGKGGVAIEGYFENSKEMQLILESFKDRETDKAAPFSVKDFQKYAHIRTAIDDWSVQIAEILSKPFCQKSGLLASSPKGANNSLCRRLPPACSIVRYFFSKSAPNPRATSCS